MVKSPSILHFKMRYSRNRIYLTTEEQTIIKDCPLLFAGCGIGSVIAECALRFGFENISIIDGDIVELSNLNRQNYSETDVSKSKAKALAERLKLINNNANIIYHNCFLTTKNLKKYIDRNRIAINALDFSSEIPLIFDSICQKQNIPILHPYNIGWGGLVAVVTPKGKSLSSLERPNETFNELNMVEYAASYLKNKGNSQEWIDDIIKRYKSEDKFLSPPQLSIASWMVASMCTHILFNIATNKKIKKFPEFYYSTIMSS